MSAREQRWERLQTGVICTKVMQDGGSFEASLGKMCEIQNRILNAWQAINTRDEKLGFMETS